MSAIINYIATLSNKSFAGIVEHFSGLGVNVQANDRFYMLVAPQDYSVFADKPQQLRDAMNQSVGTILEKETNRLVCFGFPKTQEVVDSDPAPFSGPIMAHQYTNGTLLRAYYGGDQWYLSTNGAADAYRSYWISKKSIGELFDDCLCRVYKRSTRFADSPLVSFLVPGYTYMFILQHPEMHLENAERPFFYHMGTFDNTRMVYDYNIRVDRIPQPRSFLFRNCDEMIHALATVPTGFVFFPSKATNDQSPRYKLLKGDFKHHISLIGRTSNLYLRYLEAKAEGSTVELLNHYPTMRKYSSWVEKSLRAVANEVATVYIEKYVKRNYDIHINFYLRPVVAAIREAKIHVSNFSVYEHLSTYHPKKLNFILNGMEFINTGDVRLPTAEEQTEVLVGAPIIAPVPVIAIPPPIDTAVFTQEELDELDEMLEKDIQSRKMADKTTEEYLATLDEAELEDFLRPRIMPMLVSELQISEDEECSMAYDYEHVFGILLGHDLFTLAAAYDDDANLIPLIHDCAEISFHMPMEAY